VKRVALGLALAACGSHAGGDSDAAPGGIDARDPADARPDGHCTATTPRTAPPGVFVGPTGLRQRMLDTINGAKTSLDIQMYLWTDVQLTNATIAAHQRGVAVRVLLDPDEAGNMMARTMLTQAGVATRNDPASFTYSHAKYVIADGVATIMSANWNSGAMIDERNYGAVDRDADDVADLQTIFDADWAQKPVAMECTRLFVSPTNAKPRLLALIDGATKTLDLEVLYVTDTDVLAAIVAAHDRGVAVRVMLADPTTTDGNATTKTFLGGKGVEVRTIDALTFPLHAKLVVADGVAFVGSENLSYTSLIDNREVGLLVFEPDAMAPITTQVEADWKIATR